MWSLPMSLRWPRFEAKSVVYSHSYCFIDFFQIPQFILALQCDSTFMDDYQQNEFPQ